MNKCNWLGKLTHTVQELRVQIKAGRRDQKVAERGFRDITRDEKDENHTTYERDICKERELGRGEGPASSGRQSGGKRGCLDGLL